jgi:hypothetical protein
MFMTLEQDLRRALERKDPSSGFDQRVLSSIASGDAIKAPSASRRLRGRVWLPVAASLAIAFGATYYVQQQERQALEQRARTEQAAHDVALALRIASEDIAAAQAKLRR